MLCKGNLLLSIPTLFINALKRLFLFRKEEVPERG